MQAYVLSCHISIHAPARGATGKVETKICDMGISIHAPARGATYPKDYEESENEISIHAPARGATVHIILKRTSREKFQSTLPRGERLVGMARYITKDKISIHAPARGATAGNRPHSQPGRYFNPRSREGSDKQSRKKKTNSRNFNPRSREGSDIIGGKEFQMPQISIHAPARGATERTTLFDCVV